MSEKNLFKNNIIDSLLVELPELYEKYNEEILWWDGEFPGLHNIFGDIFNPFLDKLHKRYLRKQEEIDKSLLIRIYNFLESMATSNDVYVINVLTVTVLEKLGDNRLILQEAYKFMGSKTKDLSDQIEHYIGRV